MEGKTIDHEHRIGRIVNIIVSLDAHPKNIPMIALDEHRHKEFATVESLNKHLFYQNTLLSIP